MQDGRKRESYGLNAQRIVCSQKHAILFISTVVCIIVSIAAIAAFAHPSGTHCIAAISARNVSDASKKSQGLLLATNGKPFPWTSIRLPLTVEPLSYELFIHPNLSAFHFDGNVTVSFSVSKRTDSLLFHAKRLEISSYELFEVSVGGQTGNRIEIIEVLECVKLELFHLQLMSNILPQRKYQLKLQYSGKLTDSLTGFYRSSYETRSGEKR